MDLSKRIRQRRKQLKMTQEDLQEVSGVNQSMISKYEKGDTEPSAEKLVALASGLQTTTDWLLGLTDHVNPPVVKESDLNEMEREVLKIFRSKVPEKQKQAVEIMKAV
jgi:transcriptional regulator with XRE-family HTH domain